MGFPDLKLMVINCVLFKINSFKDCRHILYYCLYVQLIFKFLRI